VVENSTFFDNTLTAILCTLILVHRRILKGIEVKDKECPVLHTPLTADNAIKLDKCGHYLSLEAWEKIEYTLEKGETEKFKKCPLCRAGHNHNDYE
jgi:hypothetical protein